MKKESRVRYIGPPRSGVPQGRMGTLLEPIQDGITMVKWDPYEGVDCQVTHSGAAESDLEEVTPIPRCKTPTLPGVYLMVKPRGSIEVARISWEESRLRICYGISIHDLDDIDQETKWWGPIEAL